MCRRGSVPLRERPVPLAYRVTLPTMTSAKTLRPTAMRTAMVWRKIVQVCALGGAILCLLARAAQASEYHGQVLSGGYPVPGASITATRGTQKFTTVSDAGGLYSFADLADGEWTIEIQMQCFSMIRSIVTIAPKAPAATWELRMLPVDPLIAQSKQTASPSALISAPSAASAVKTTQSTETASAATQADIPKPQQEDERSSDGLLVNGSSNNAATSKYSIDQAFGNSRSGGKGLYNGGLAAIFDNSALDARPYSLSGLDTPKTLYNRFTGVLTFGGPIRIPHVLPHGPKFFLVYEWTRDRVAATQAGLVPTAAERAGDLSGVVDALGRPVRILDPANAQPFAGNIVPVSAQARALLQLYPLPNLAGTARYNYQIPVLNTSHQDALLSRLDKTLGRKDQVYGAFYFTSVRASSTNLFGFVDKTDTLGINTNINWSHRFSQHLFLFAGYRFSRFRTHTTPYFQNRRNVSGDAGIRGNNQEAAYWGPPALYFSGGISPLSDAQSAFNRSRTDAFTGSVAVYRGRHNITVGGDLRKQQFNDLFQQDPRGTFTFTGAATGGANSSSGVGSDLADFLLGVPDTSSIAFGNADKYLRQTVYDAYATDDWRVLPTLTINAGVRWEYGAPITELRGRLVNLDVEPGFSAAKPVLASSPVGPLTGNRYPSSLLRPDRLGFEPRVGVSWRPIPASTIVVRAGYGIYHDTSVYQTPALALAQQAPLSKSLSVQNSATCPLTLANGFLPCSAITANTFAVDPNFRVGYAQTWQLAVQRDLPGALQLTATYLGVKGTRGVQQFLPNTYPIGGANPCPSCPSGFVYQTSGGDSTRESGQLQLRRRLRSGFTASLLYTYSKSIDNDAFLGGGGHVPSTSQSQSSPQTTTTSAQTQTSASPATTIAQNWRDLRAERSRSSFDQRHLLNLQAQYTSGEGLGGGTLMSGRSGKLLKEWTVLAQMVVGSGLPETPIYLAAVPGAGFTGTIRPNLTGADIYAGRPGYYLNSAAFVAPSLGSWGTAGRNSINGPSQFSLNSSLARTFRPGGRFYLDARVDATNLLNHVVFTSWNPTVNSTQFGVPVAANPMRSLETTLRLRF